MKEKISPNAFMLEAIKLGHKAINENLGKPFGAVVVSDNKIIGKGHNTTLSEYDPTAHAEIVAIRNACFNLKQYRLENCQLYTTCEPCPMCLGAIYWAGITAVYFGCSMNDAKDSGFDDSLIYKQFNLPWEKREIKSEQILREKAIELFKIWQKI